MGIRAKRSVFAGLLEDAESGILYYSNQFFAIIRDLW